VLHYEYLIAVHTFSSEDCNSSVGDGKQYLSVATGEHVARL